MYLPCRISFIIFVLSLRSTTAISFFGVCATASRTRAVPISTTAAQIETISLIRFIAPSPPSCRAALPAEEWPTSRWLYSKATRFGIAMTAITARRDGRHRCEVGRRGDTAKSDRGDAQTRRRGERATRRHGEGRTSSLSILPLPRRRGL